MAFTVGQIMFYGGILGAILCVLTVLILIKVFDKRRKKKLDEIMKSL